MERSRRVFQTDEKRGTASALKLIAAERERRTATAAASAAAAAAAAHQDEDLHTAAGAPLPNDSSGRGSHASSAQGSHGSERVLPRRLYNDSHDGSDSDIEDDLGDEGEGSSSHASASTTTAAPKEPRPRLQRLVRAADAATKPAAGSDGARHGGPLDALDDIMSGLGRMGLADGAGGSPSRDSGGGEGSHGSCGDDAGGSGSADSSGGDGPAAARHSWPPQQQQQHQQDHEEPSEDFTLDGGFRLPARVAGKLYPHQSEGLRWLWSLHLRKEGGILADDMGLGKTMQCSAFLAGSLGAGAARRALVVAPKTLLAHWEKELGACGLRSQTHRFYGTSDGERQAALRALTSRRGGVLLTTYGMVLHNAEALARGSGRIPDDEDGASDAGGRLLTWDYLILDEGHKIKNPSMQLAQRMRALSARVRLIISGTPIQNNLTEM